MATKFLDQKNEVDLDLIAQGVRMIIEGIGASQYGIGIVCARLAETVLRDEGCVFPVGSYRQQYGVTLSLPTVIGRHGVLRTLPPKMSQEERDGLERSALVLREALEGARRRDG